MMKIGVLLAGSGVFDGSEIHEATFGLLAIDQAGHQAVCIAPDKPQHHVLNHMNGEELNETRNVLIESARIARGDIKPLSEVPATELDALFIPGGFGAAKNLNQWAIKGPDGDIDDGVRELIKAMAESGKPICAVCMGPTVVAKALEGSGISATLTVGSTAEPSPYDIGGIAQGVESIGMKTEPQNKTGVTIDRAHKIVSAPAYNMETTISEVHKNVTDAMQQMFRFLA